MAAAGLAAEGRVGANICPCAPSSPEKTASTLDCRILSRPLPCLPYKCNYQAVAVFPEAGDPSL